MQIGIDNCKVKLRKWILVPKPSRWTNRAGKRNRLVVFSPMLEILENVSQIPVKLVSSEEENSVCFLRPDDFETLGRHYRRMKINSLPWLVDAHGVAIVDSTDDDFRYEKGDRFWIDAGGNVEDYITTNTVPVINLQTFKDGIIDARHVCWFPRIRGPKEDLWTLGGDRRELRSYGPDRSLYWSFVVRQTLDGEPPTVEFLPIPTKDAPMEDVCELSPPERRSLFNERYKCLMLESSSEASSIEPLQNERQDFSTRRSSTVLPRSLWSFDLRVHKIVSAEKRLSDVEVFRRIHSFAMSNNKILSKRPQALSSHPTTSTPYHKSRHSRRRPINSVGCSDSDPSFIEGSMSSSSFTSRKSPTLEPPRGSPVSRGSEPDAGDYLYEVLQEIPNGAFYGSGREREARSSASSFLANHFGNTTDSISDRWTLENKDPNGRPRIFSRLWNAKLCNLTDPDCTYSTLYTTKHYHSPADKCVSNSHEHCVSRLHAFPGDAGGCILRSMPSRLHQCCYWEDKDRRGWPTRRRREPEDLKLKEAVEKGLQIYDTSVGVTWEAPPVDLRAFGDLAPGLEDLEDSIARGEEELDLDALWTWVVLEDKRGSASEAAGKERWS